MHKCKCGHEFEGNFCPNCGAKWQEEKPMSLFHATINLWMVELRLWAKLNKKGLIITAAIFTAMIIALTCTLVILLSPKIEGTYYKLKNNGETDKTTYFIIKSGTWEDEDGEKGTYKLDGDKITFYVTFMDETEELCDGTIADGKLTINGVFGNDVYITENYKGETKSTSSAFYENNYIADILVNYN